MYFKPNTLQALEAESGRGEGPTLNLSFHSSLVKHKLGLGWSTSFLVRETGVIPPTLWGFEEDCVSSRHQADAHGLPESGVPATLICFLRVASLTFCSVSMSELWAHSHRGCSLSRVSEKCWGSCSIILVLFSVHSLPVWKAVGGSTWSSLCYFPVAAPGTEVLPFVFHVISGPLGKLATLIMMDLRGGLHPAVPEIAVM